jgi:hypothetical protein
MIGESVVFFLFYFQHCIFEFFFVILFLFLFLIAINLLMSIPVRKDCC